MARHRAPRRRGHNPQPPPRPAADHTNPDTTGPPSWLRVVRSPEDVLADHPADPVHLLPAKPRVTVQYESGERLTVPIENGMVIQLTCVDGAPRVSVVTG